jgi:EamA-like transporter family.
LKVIQRIKNKFGASLKTYAQLNLLLLVYSFGAIFSKLASSKQYFLIEFILYYSIVLLLLVIYAVGWQQILKKLPLSVAFANKSIVVIWGIIWGVTIFREKLTVGMIIGSLFVVCGIFFVVRDDE